MIKSTRQSMANSKPSSFKAYILAARPKTLFAGLTPPLIGLAYCYLQDNLNFLLGIMTIAVVLILQIATNYVNDAYDALDGVDDETRLGPERMTSLGYLSFAQMKRGYQTAFTVAFMIGLIIVAMTNLIVLSLGLLALIFAYIYTAGPYPLSRMGLGELTAFFFFGPYAVFGTVYIQQQNFNATLFLLSMLPGIASAQLMNINNLRDRVADMKVKKHTISTLLSEKTARKIPLVLSLLNILVVVLLSLSLHPIFLLGALPWILWLILNAKKIIFGPIDQSMNSVLAKTGGALFVQGIIIVGILIL
jgi:1,4-dihydroxy-2-naphthoate polyprenyltransferase